MNKSFSFFDLPNEALQEMEVLFGRVEEQLKSNPNCDLRQYLTGISEPAEQLYLLSVVVPLQMEYTGETFTNKKLKEYQERYPEVAQMLSQVFAKKDLTHISEDTQRTIRSDQSFARQLKIWPGEIVGQRYRIASLLGTGSFGVVYRAYDSSLKRDVALKVAQTDLAFSNLNKEKFLTEAQNSANINTNGIATIYDLFEQDDKIFIVQQYVAGQTLQQFLVTQQFSQEQAVQLVIEIATAISHAHDLGVCHRDLKPSNIIIKPNGRATIVDFGLAMTVQSKSASKVVCGTPNYMAPEQVRGEVNRTDQQSDVWSLGVILYEFLAGEKPFDASEMEEVFELVKFADAVSLKEIDSKIPDELNRIVLKCLAKKKSNRYADVEQLITDLKRLQNHEIGESHQVGYETKIEPKGLRPFSDGDSAFFLHLLPGPRNHQGIPESVLFWKRRIENASSPDSFPVGLIYGASGCGKTSFVRAGLLPVLNENIHVVYIEAAGNETTELRLLKSLRQKFPGLPDDVSLPEAFALIRDGEFLKSDEKLLVVVDQFEQWLSSHQNEYETQLSAALRHCDSLSIQTILMIREDYWPSTSRFMDQLEVPLVQNENCRTVDLFDIDHAKSILAAYGRAFGKLASPIPEDQSKFLNKVVAGFSEDGKVVSARLAFFAEAFRDKPWNTESLLEIGGVDGVGVSYLNEKFVDSSAAKNYKIHHAAAQSCLAALLPESQSGLKGHMVSKKQLMQLSGYQSQDDKFEQLLGILDQETRLITATSPLADKDNIESVTDLDTYYQLSHDYLVPILRRWIDSEQQRRISGRTIARMSQVASIWRDLRHKRYLPTFAETASFLAFSNWNSWTPIQQRMMRASLIRHLPLAFVLAVGLVVTAIFCYRYWNSVQQDRFVDRLRDYSISEIVNTAATIDTTNESLKRKLKLGLAERQTTNVSDKEDRRRNQLNELKHSVLLSQFDDSYLENVAKGIGCIDPEDVPMITEILEKDRDQISADFVNYMESHVGKSGSDSINRAIVLNEWGLPKYLTDFAIESDVSKISEFRNALSHNRDQILEVLQAKVAQLEPKVPSRPSNKLRELFGKSDGSIGMLGAIVFAADEEDVDDYLQAAFREGYVPCCYRPFRVRKNKKIAISWQRALKQLPKVFDDYVRIIVTDKPKKFEDEIQGLLKDGWLAQDISIVPKLGEQNDTFYALLVKPRDSKNKRTTLFEFDADLEQLERKAKKYTPEGYQVARMFARLTSEGQTRYSVIWDKYKNSEARILPSLCIPEIEYEHLATSQPQGVSRADCNFLLMDPSEKDWYYLHESMIKRHATKAYLNNNPTPIKTVNAPRFLNLMVLNQWTNRIEDANEVAGRLLRDLPDWVDSKVRISHLYSIQSDIKKFENELTRISDFDMSDSTKGILLPLCKLRSSVVYGKTEAAKQIYNDFLSHASELEIKHQSNSEAIQFIQRARARSRIILARCYEANSIEQKKLIDEGMSMFMACGDADYGYMADQDFDIVRGNSSFHHFLWKHNRCVRTVESNRVEYEVASQTDQATSVRILVGSANRWLASDFRPRVTACFFDPYKKKVTGKMIWEQPKQIVKLRDKQRLANVAILMAQMGDTQLLQRVNSGNYDSEIQKLIPRSLRMVKNTLSSIDEFAD